ncbi:hypothetical protein HUT16_30670 [Kitasatospora sp. NA04385]|nr:DUF6879 family protein [Kitasatospora sp. NA04385]QKW22874.1 hypothetical protein HUT16_30670 [Kitasatospora sp. NA04385]
MLPGNDLWLFDGRVAKFGLFSGDGAFLGNVMSDDPEVVKRRVGAFEAGWQRAVPQQDFELQRARSHGSAPFVQRSGSP